MILPDKVKRQKQTPERRAREAKERRSARVEAETQRLLSLDKERARRVRPPRDLLDYDDKDLRRGKFILRWVQVFGTREVQVSHLEPHAQWFEELVADETLWFEEWRPVSAGRLLAGMADKVFGSFTLKRRGATNGAYRWQVVNIAPSQFEEE
jgi:hypothetical protein